jgi:hypothetical protein
MSFKICQTQNTIFFNEFLTFQVYNEQVRDLLNPKGNLAVRDDSNQGFPLQSFSIKIETDESNL